MGGEQAASVLATVHRDADKWTPEQAEKLQAADPRGLRGAGQSLARHRAAVGRRHHRSGADARRARAGLRRDAERADPRPAAVRRVQDVTMKIVCQATVQPRSRFAAAAAFVEQATSSWRRQLGWLQASSEHDRVGTRLQPKRSGPRPATCCRSQDVDGLGVVVTLKLVPAVDCRRRIECVENMDADASSA